MIKDAFGNVLHMQKSRATLKAMASEAVLIKICSMLIIEVNKCIYIMAYHPTGKEIGYTYKITIEWLI